MFEVWVRESLSAYGCLSFGFGMSCPLKDVVLGLGTLVRFDRFGGRAYSAEPLNSRLVPGLREYTQRKMFQFRGGRVAARSAEVPRGSQAIWGAPRRARGSLDSPRSPATPRPEVFLESCSIQCLQPGDLHDTCQYKKSDQIQKAWPGLETAHTLTHI